MADTSGLRVAGVSVSLGQRRVLEGVDMEVGRGEIVGLIGPNGAGKTTLLRAVLGLVDLDEGTVEVDGRPHARGRTRVGYVPQRHEFAWDFPIPVRGAVLSGRTRMIGWLRRPGADDHRAVEAAIARVGLMDLAERPIGELSGGQRQRVLVARALALEPDVLLLDEPYTGVDLPTQELLTELMGSLAASGAAVVMTTHDLSSAARSCRRICLLNRVVVATGTPEELADPALWLKAFGVDSSADLVAAIARHGST